MSDNTKKVTGIGGIFFRVRDPARMSVWYREHLGICAEDGHMDFLWREHERPEEIGRTVCFSGGHGLFRAISTGVYGQLPRC